MKQMTIPVKENVKIDIKASDDLAIHGTQDKYLTAIVQSGDCLKISEENERLIIRATDDCRLVVPETSVIIVEKVGGDLFVTGLANRMIIGKVGGDLALEQVNSASIETVGGDLGFKEIEGTLEIARVGGDLDGEKVGGLTSRAIGGDANVLEFTGEMDLAAGGDASLSSSVVDLPQMNIRAGGDIKLIVSPEAKAQLEIRSGGEEISIHACGQEVNWETGEVSLPLCDGGALIKLEAGDEVVVTDHDSVSRDFERIFDRTKEEWEDFAIDLKKTIQEGLVSASDSIDQIVKQAAKAGKKAGVTVHTVTNHQKDKWINKSRKDKMVGLSFDEPESEKPKVARGVSDEERMMVLRMLQEKKITVEEAQKLLSALDQ